MGILAPLQTEGPMSLQTRKCGVVPAGEVTAERGGLLGWGDGGGGGETFSDV